MGRQFVRLQVLDRVHRAEISSVCGKNGLLVCFDMKQLRTEARIYGLSHATWMYRSWVLQTKESCSVAPPAGAQRADRHTAVQTEGGAVGADGRCFGGGRGGRAVRRTRMLNLFKALCVYIWSVSWLIFSWCFYEDESILKQVVTNETCSPLLSPAVMGNVGILTDLWTWEM